MNFDDPKPPKDTRQPLSIYIRPSLKEAMDQRRGKLNRSEWIEIAIRQYLRQIGELGL